MERDRSRTMNVSMENSSFHSSPPQDRHGGRSRWQNLRTSAATRIKSMSFMPKWFILASVIGVIAGLGAVVFYEALTLATHFFLAFLAGYQVPTPAGEGNSLGSATYIRAWAIPLVVILGGLISGFIVFTWAPEAEGHGTDAAIDAIHHNPRGIRLRAVVVKIIASAVMIGSGGSGGREGPTAQISAGFGSLMARFLDLSPEDGRIAVSVGIGSGIGAIFSAPLGGALLAADIVYRDDFEFEALLPGLLASIIAYAIFGAVYGYQPLFVIHGGYNFTHPMQLVWFAVLGVVAGGMGLVYSRSFYCAVALAQKLPFTRKLRPAVGAILTGLIALWLPEVLGTGYGWVQMGMSAQLDHLPLYILLLLPFARIAATSFSIGSGGSGGVFGPGMVIGSFTGLALWHLLQPWAPGIGHDPAAFVVVGMMAVFGAISRAPIAVMLMVGEMTGNMSLLAPAMVAVAIAWLIVGRSDDSIYRSQLRTKADSPARRLTFGLPLLTTMKVADIARPAVLTIKSHTPAAEALEGLRAAALPGAPVVSDAQGTYVGVVSTSHLEQFVSSNPNAEIDGAVESVTAPMPVSAKLDVGLEIFLQSGLAWVPVVDDDRQVVGVLSASDLVRGYNKVLDSRSGYAYNITSHALAIEARVGEGASVAGHMVRDAGLPSGCALVWVQHEGVRSRVQGSTEIHEGDVISAIVAAEKARDFRLLLRGKENSKKA
ncbi:MAG: CBS domain-containing protein [Actinomycetota bacterium]|nr:MAG: CBS domain-containing protein [Actinomycetota bacterium]